MIVTLNEVQRACQKALFGAGAPAGLDDDGAGAAVWLEARGVPALPPLAAALERWAGTPGACALTETAPGAVDAGGRSAVFAGPFLIDMAATRASRFATADLKVAALSDPRFLVPAADDLSRSGLSFQISWPGRGAAADPVRGVTLLGDWGPPLDGTCDVAIRCRQGALETFDPALPVAYGPAELDTRYRDTLAAGLEVAEPVWRAIERFAHRALVPASAESRARGAGSTASDNE